MTPKKKVASGSSESSSGSSSSGSSSSGSSSSGSDSSSSSDSDSSSSPDETPAVKDAPKGTEPPKKLPPGRAPPPRKSTEKRDAPASKPDEKITPPTKQTKTTPQNSKIKSKAIISSDSDSPPKSTAKPPPKRKIAPTKPKSTATVTPKPSPVKQAPKQPPIIKAQQKTAPLAKNLQAKTGQKNVQPEKVVPKPAVKPPSGKNPPTGKHPPVSKLPPIVNKQSVSGKMPPGMNKHPQVSGKHPPTGKHPPVTGKNPPITGKHPPVKHPAVSGTVKHPVVTGSVKHPPVTGKHPPAILNKSTGGKAPPIDKKNKKKSIFSPENSSESDSGVSKTPVKVQPKQAPKPRPKPRPSVEVKVVPTPKPVEKPKQVHVSTKEDVKKPVPITRTSKSTSESSLTSDSSDSSSSSDSDSSADSAATSKNPVKKTAPLKRGAHRNSTGKTKDSDSDGETSQNTTNLLQSSTRSDTDGDTSAQNNTKKNAKAVTARKLTRSAVTARKSKHLMGKSSVFTDTDSDTESTKRSITKSPVKRAPAVTKGKAKNSKRTEAKGKSNESDVVMLEEERKCPLDNCDSMGHLSGKFEKHFTVEGCPMYHNTTIQKCKDGIAERKKHEEEHKKAIEAYKKVPKFTPPTIEQKGFSAKIKEMRSKFKAESEDDFLCNSTGVADKNKEPDLSSVVPEYDLKLFREAQAMASEKIEEELKTLPPTKGTKFIEMGRFEMEVWYQSPYPEDYARLPKLYLCEYCLRYMKSRTILQRHVVKCVWRHPPGEEVYRKDKICVWEVDGKKYKLYCQNLCLLARFFLDHKTLYYDVEPFLFYVMTIMDNEGCHTVGYFSKEKNSFLNYNVSCILTLPPYQRQGYGRLLIDFSYLLTRVEGKIGSPEKPLSDLGLISYRSYWKDVLLAYLCARPGTQLSIKDISQEMAINSYDIVSTLQALGMMKYWKGKHIILKKKDVLEEYAERTKRRGSQVKEVDPTCLRWKPFVVPQPTTS